MSNYLTLLHRRLISIPLKERALSERRPWGLAFLLIALLSVLLSACSPTVIEVNGEKVSRKAVLQEIRERELMHKGKPITVSDELLKKSAVSAIINRVILLQEARAGGIAVTKKEAQQEYEKFMQRFAAEGDFEEFLEERDMSKRDLRNRLRDALMVERFLQRLYGGIEVTDEEVRRYYLNQNWPEVGPVMMKAGIIKTSSEGEAQRIMSEIRRSSFDKVLWDLMRKKPRGVTVREPAWVEPEEAAPELLAEMQKIITARYAGPVRVGDEWYLIKVYARESRAPGFESVKEELRKTIHERRAREVTDRLLKERIDAAEIKVRYDRLS